MSDLERRYRKLLALYPRDHRERNGEEMLGVLMAAAGDRTWPGWRDSLDLMWSAARLHLRRAVAADGGIDPRDVLAIVSLLGPVAILAGATTGLHELAWWVQAGALWDMPLLQQIPDAPVWVVWLAVAVLSLLGRRGAAAVGAWLGTAGFVVVDWFTWWLPSLDAGWTLLGAVTAAALTWSPGPARGRELVARWSIVVLAGTVVLAVLQGVLGYGEEKLLWLTFAATAVGTVVACAPWSRAGRRAALVLLMPVMTGVLAHMWWGSGPKPLAAEAAFFYCLPVVILLATGGLPRRVRRRPDPVG